MTSYIKFFTRNHCRTCGKKKQVPRAHFCNACRRKQWLKSRARARINQREISDYFSKLRPEILQKLVDEKVKEIQEEELKGGKI